MKVLILGGTGAMGKPLTRMIANQGTTVYVTTRKLPVYPVIAICYHKSNYLSLTTILTHRFVRNRII